jgi:hypothetical protein
MHIKTWQHLYNRGIIRFDQEPGDQPNGGNETDPQDGDGNDGVNNSAAAGGLDDAPWTAEDFDAKRAWDLLTKTRGDLSKTKAERDEFKSKHDEAETAKLSDLQRTEKERDDSRTEATSLQLENARLKALIQHDLDEDDLEFIGGSTAEEIATRAAKYAERHKAAGNNDTKGIPPTNRPRPSLRGGGNPGDSELSAEEIVAKATRR